MTPGLIERLEAAGEHTPGPWRVEAGTTLIWGNCNPDDHSTRGMGYPIAEARINPSGNWSTGPYADEGEANARLIAAAPDLLEALQKLVALHDTFCARHGNQEDAYNLVATRWADFDAARAAILKARATQEQG